MQSITQENRGTQGHKLPLDSTFSEVPELNKSVLWKRTIELWAFTSIKSPLMFFIRPLVTQLDDNSTSIQVKLSRKNRNPFNSMYFGALSSGAESVPGITIVYQSRNLNIPVSFLVKEFQGNYLSKADDNIFFISKDNQAIKKAIIDSANDGKARELNVAVKAYKESQKELVATFVIKMSLKSKRL